MTVRRALKEMGVEIDHKNTLPKGTRSSKDLFSRVIDAVRAAEDFNREQLDAANATALEAQSRLLECKEECERLRAALIPYRMRERLGEDNYAQLTEAQKQKLLSVADE